MKHLSLTLSLIVGLIAPSWVFANDSEGGWGLTGGLVFKKNEAITMLSEDLFLSPELVRVTYTYENTTSGDVDILVAFPIRSPSFLWGRSSSFVEYIKQLNFKTWVNDNSVDWWPYFGNNTPWGDKCRELWNQRNSLYDKEGYCFKSRIGKIKFDNSDCNTSELVLNDDIKAKISSIKELEKEYSCKAEPITRNINPYSETEDYVSILRNQKFPAKSITKVVHEYTPDFLGGIPQYGILSMVEALKNEEALWAEVGCLDKKKALDIVTKWENTFRASHSPDDEHFWSGQLISNRNLSYILKTGKNWNGRIGKFRMEVSTGNTEAILDTCFEGLKRVSQTSYIFEAEDYLPNENIDITFYNWPYD